MSDEKCPGCGAQQRPYPHATWHGKPVYGCGTFWEHEVLYEGRDCLHSQLAQVTAERDGLQVTIEGIQAALVECRPETYEEREARFERQDHKITRSKCIEMGKWKALLKAAKGGQP